METNKLCSFVRRSFEETPSDEKKVIIGYYSEEEEPPSDDEVSLTQEAEAAEGILGKALSVAYTRQGSLLSLQSAPRLKAVEMGRHASGLSYGEVEAGDNNNHYYDNDNDGDSLKSTKSLDPVFIKAPKGNPAILTQRSWDAIVEMENDKGVGERQLRTVLSDKEMASLQPNRKWDNLRRDLKNQEKQGNKGTILTRGLKKTFAVFKRKEKLHPPAFVSPVSTGTDSLLRNDANQNDDSEFGRRSGGDSAGSSKSSNSEGSPQSDKKAENHEQKDLTNVVPGFKSSRHGLVAHSDTDEDLELEELEVPLESLDFPRQKAAVADPEVMILKSEIPPDVYETRNALSQRNNDDDICSTMLDIICPSESMEFPLEGLEAPMESPSVAAPEESQVAANTKHEETKAVDVSSNLVADLDAMREEKKQETLLADLDADLDLKVAMKNTADVSKRESILYNLIRRKNKSKKLAGKDPPGLVQTTEEKEPEDSDGCTGNNCLITTDNHRITVETQEWEDCHSSTPESMENESMEVELSELVAVDSVDVFCGMLPSFGSKLPQNS